MLGASWYHYSEQNTWYTTCFSGMEQEKDTVQFEQWLHAISDALERTFNEQLIRDAMNK